jgi:hypothetical protein
LGSGKKVLLRTPPPTPPKAQRKGARVRIQGSGFYGIVRVPYGAGTVSIVLYSKCRYGYGTEVQILLRYLYVACTDVPYRYRKGLRV